MSPSMNTNDRDAVGCGESVASFCRLRAGAFWTAVVLPFCALGVVLSGLETTGDYALLVAVLAVNVLALYTGHDYRQ